MAFIEKKDPIVLNIKLTSKGRELLSKGELNFRYFAIGDSEIDYEFNRETGFNSFNSSVLRPADKNPHQLSFISKNLDGDGFNEISSVPSTESIVENQISSIGFFNESGDEFLTDSDHVKQPDAMIEISGVTGGTRLEIKKAPYYLSNPNEPQTGDLLLVKWANPNGIDTTGYTVNKNNPTPYLWYKVQNINSGSLNNDNLVIEVDRELPDFSNITGVTGNSVVAGALFYYNYINFTGDTFSTDQTDDALIAFLQNCQCPTITFPFWNMSIVYTDNIIGVDPNNNKTFGEYNTKDLGGFVSYIQNQGRNNSNYKRKLGVIHYTNNSVANTYAEGFFGDPLNSEDANKIPKLSIPHIMWHKSNTPQLGLILKPIGQLKYLTGVTKSLNTRYYDLADGDNNVVGKVFYDLKTFVIEDQELLFAMSYKSNRSWTLPNYGVDINANVTFGCSDCVLQYSVATIPPTTIGGSDGQIIISGITNYIGNPQDGDLVLEILSGGTGNTNQTQVFFNKITGDTIITNNNTLNNFNLSAITYTVKLTDLGAPNCTIISEITLNEVQTTLSIINIQSTYNNLIPYFHVSAYDNNPVRIRIFSDNSGDSGIGIPLGDAYMTIANPNTDEVALNNRSVNSTGNGNDAVNDWVKIPQNSYLETNNLTFKNPYVIYVRDLTGGTITDVTNNQNIIDTQVWTYYVSVTNPLVTPNLTIGSDSNGQYVTVSNFLIAPNPTKNPLDGTYEASLYKQGDEPKDWVYSIPVGDGGPIKIYAPSNPSGNYKVAVRERRDYIETYRIISTGTINF